MDKVDVFFAAARELSGGKLSQSQVDSLDAVVTLLTPQGDSMNVSAEGLAMIKQFEGLRLEAYLDSAGIWTIGYGTIVYPNGKKVAKGDKITQADQYKLHDLKTFVNAVNGFIKVPVTQNQFDAIVSLTYNIGVGAIGGSTLIKKLNAKDYKGAAEQFLVWNKGRVKGVLQVIPGLTNRRIKEKAHFEKK